MESLLERVGLAGVVGETYETLRDYVLGRQPGESLRPMRDTPSVAPRGEVHEVPEPVVSLSLPPLPATGRMEVRRAETWREASAGSRKAPRAKKVARPKKKARPTAVRKTASESHKKTAVGKTPGPARAPASEPEDAVGTLVDALRAHPKQEELVAAGRQKDQLLRSLIPLYLARSLDVEVTSGTTSRFWGELGVTYAAPNAAKALRLHTGFAQDTKKGKAITSKGIKYVESALAQRR
ncbi:hypothetical protein DAT35_03155 [Vitiosangium sp. GDMCC 1.1324]|nr:hypothetical protein DAT35_03155 [Vitiosangium sp. GDMCC 1.1324]